MALELVDKPTNLISINTENKCSNCGKGGAVDQNPAGLCMTCIADKITNKINAKNTPNFTASKDQQFAVAKEAENIGRELIGKFHKHLASTRIEYVFLSNTPTTKGTETWGRAKKISGLNAWLADEEKEDNTLPESFFVIEFAYEVWVTLDEKGRRALVDHELSHCQISEELKPCLRPHDCEEFNQVIRRNGLWRTDVKNLLEAAKEAENNPLFAKAA